MGKPGPIETVNNPKLTLDEFRDELVKQADCFVRNLKNLPNKYQKSRTLFEWFYTLGWWNESLEYIDEFPEQRKHMLEIVQDR